MLTPAQIPGYTYGNPALATSPVSLDDLRLLERTLMFGEEDVRCLRIAGEILEDQIDEILDVWYGFVGSQPHLLAIFSSADGVPDANYLAAVKLRFGQWIRDVCGRPYDQAWLDYQEEIAQRHYRTKKNKTDNAAAAPIVPLSHLMALTYAITATIRPFLAKSGRSNEDVEKMHAAWSKAVLLSVTLWARPYVREGDF